DARVGVGVGAVRLAGTVAGLTALEARGEDAAVVTRAQLGLALLVAFDAARGARVLAAAWERSGGVLRVLSREREQREEDREQDDACVQQGSHPRHGGVPEGRGRGSCGAIQNSATWDREACCRA